MPSGGVVRIIFSSFLFVLTGLVQTVCIQSVLYSGGGDRSTFLLALPNYLGIVCVTFFGSRAFHLLDNLGVWCSQGSESSRVHLSIYQHHNSKQHPQLSFLARIFHRDRRKFFILAFNELGGFLTGLTGLSIAGSGLYQVVFSGATVFTAILTTFFLRKSLSVLQWLSVAIITSGLMITAEQVTHMPRSISSATSGSDSEADAASVISGIAFVLVSCLFYSTNYVIAEYVLGTGNVADSGGASCNGGSGDDEDDVPSSTLPAPTGLDLSFYTGGSCLGFFSVYVLAHTLPNWNELVTSSIEKHHGNTTLIAEYYIYLGIASFVHAITHYDVLATIGAVSIGVLNALRATSVFAASSWLFCSHQTSQCYSSRKGISTAIVIGGALAYSVASAAASRKNRKPSGRSTVGQVIPRDEINHYSLARVGRRLKKAVSNFIGRNQRLQSTSAASSHVSLTSSLPAAKIELGSGSVSNGSGSIKSSAVIGPGSGAISINSNHEGWSTSVKTSASRNG